MRVRKPQAGDFIKYILNPGDVEGLYGFVFKVDSEYAMLNDGQAVWFGEKQHCKKYRVGYKEFSISGVRHGIKKDCQVISHPPKKILCRLEKALAYIEKEGDIKIDNLLIVEVLAKMKGLV